MVYAVRRYVKGIKNSGTRDVWVGDYLPSEEEIVQNFGREGKYIIIQRGKGIRGFNKVAEYGPYETSQSFNPPPEYKTTSEWLPKAFAAEEHSINVKQQINIMDISDVELDKLWGSMLETPVESEEDFERFSQDTQKIRAEINRRLGDRSNLIESMSEDGVVAETAMAENQHLAEALSVANLAAEENGGHSTLAVVMAGVTGLVVGGVAQEVRWGKKMSEAEERMARLESQINQLVEKEEERASEEKAAPKENPFSTTNLLRQFNANNMR